MWLALRFGEQLVRTRFEREKRHVSGIAFDAVKADKDDFSVPQCHFRHAFAGNMRIFRFLPIGERLFGIEILPVTPVAEYKIVGVMILEIIRAFGLVAVR